MNIHELHKKWELNEASKYSFVRMKQKIAKRYGINTPKYLEFCNDLKELKHDEKN